MRRYATGLQLVLLVCAGAASGYLWRAALDPRTSVAPSFVLRGQETAPTWLFVKPRATPGHLRVRAQTKRSVNPQTPAKRASPAVKKRVSPTVKRHELHPSAELASVATPQHTVPQTKPAQTKPTPSPSKKHKPWTAPSRPKKLKPRTVTPPAAPPQPTPPPSPAAPVPLPAASNPSAKPGWGKGDSNHDHTGPPGQSGKGNSKK